MTNKKFDRGQLNTGLDWDGTGFIHCFFKQVNIIHNIQIIPKHCMKTVLPLNFFFLVTDIKNRPSNK